jgi:XTP/dITP diphosphohydrolase
MLIDSTPPQIVIATGNAGKLKEFQQLFAPLLARGTRLISTRELGIADPEETGTTFIENALIKARHAAQISGLPSIADDSGLCVDALRGAPGLISAHYAGVHGDAAGNIAKLLRELTGAQQRRARFVSVVVMLQHANDPQPICCEGQWQGQIAERARGMGGFGYDPIFIDESGLTAAELDESVKNQRSHRGQAALMLLRRLMGDSY